jgi:light-regulated signal transduction histidine kinase (bacteriophytochrome)
VTNRFSFVPGSNDETNTLPDKIYRCEDEPIHIPGAIQRFGALVVMRENGSGFLLVRIGSENSHSVICHEPVSLQPSMLH